MQALDNLIDKLNTDSYSAVSIFNLDTNSFLFRNKSHAEIIAEYGSAEEFFESLFAKGCSRLTLTLKRKNGSSYKIDGESFDVNFSKMEQSQNQNPQTPVEVIKTPQVDLFSNSFGLGTLDIMNLMVAKNDASRLFTEVETLKAENKEYKKKYEDIREEQLASKYDTNKSKGTQEMLLGAIQQLPTLIGFVKGTAPVAGLAAPMELYSSEVKQHFATALQSIDDTVVGVLESIANGLNTNVEFSNELAQLLKKTPIMGSIKNSVTIDIKTINPFEIKAKTRALTELGQLDTDVLDKLAELSKSPKAITQLKTNFPMIKGFLSN